MMDISATTRRAYDLINAGDLDKFGELMADDFIEHEETPGFPPTKEGVLDMFRIYRTAFPDPGLETRAVMGPGRWRGHV
jgi:ketosteroid isomerase-like protein